MSEAAEKAVRAAEEAMGSFSSNIMGKSLDIASQMAQIRTARELTLIRGEMRAIRILLSEQLGSKTAAAGDDMGNA